MITTEEAERLARGCDTEGFKASAAALRSLAAERDTLRAENARLREALKEFSCNCVSNCDWERSDICPSWIARTALGEKE